MDVIVRDATVEDAHAIADVHVASWRWAYRGQLSDDLLSRLSVDDRETMWTACLLGPEVGASVLVASTADGRIVGFANAGRSRDDGARSGTGELRALYLLREAQGTGVGRSLHDEAIARLRDAGFTDATLWVLETNELARRFYERAGWRWDGSVSEHMFECGNRPIVRYARELSR